MSKEPASYQIRVCLIENYAKRLNVTTGPLQFIIIAVSLETDPYTIPKIVPHRMEASVLFFNFQDPPFS
jgi:hypothetical protein